MSDIAVRESDTAGTADPDPAADSGGWMGLAGLLGLVVALGLLAGRYWLMTIGAIVFMIFMHELGHFTTARLTGMKVTEFFIGFGPRIWSFRRGETEYGVKAIPAGAYVRIIGMNNLDDVEPEDDGRAYRDKSYPRKFLVAVAGSAMHFAMAFVLLVAVFAIYGERLDRDEAASTIDDWTIAAVSVDSAAAAIGLEPGDRLVRVGGVETTTFSEFGETVVALGGEQVEVVFERDGVEMTEVATIGERLSAEGAAGLAGFLEGDRLLAVNGQPVQTYSEFVDLAVGAGEVEVTFVDVLTGKPSVVEGVRVSDPAPASIATTGFFGVGPDYARDGLGLLTSIGRSVEELGSQMKAVVGAFGRIFTPGSLASFVSDTVQDSDTGDLVADGDGRELETRRLDAANPDENRIISIYGAARIGAQAADNGYEGWLALMIGINLFVGVFNLVPLPPLDGGHIAVATYERIRGIGGRQHRADAARLVPLTYAVLGFLVFIGLLAVFRDIVDPINL